MVDEKRRMALARKMLLVWWNKLDWEKVSDDTRDACFACADYILAEQERRERILLTGIDNALRSLRADPERKSFARVYLQEACDKFYALDAEPPKEPTLAEAVEAMLRSAPRVVYGIGTSTPQDVDGTRLEMVRPNALEAVRAALAREKEAGR